MATNLIDYCTVYSSSSVGPMVENDLSFILNKSRSTNDWLGITGVLLYVHGSVVQVLEGEQNAVETLYQRIARGPRYTNVIRVVNKPISKYLFGEWSMDYETITSRQLEDIKEIIAIDKPKESVSRMNEPIILTTLKAFYENNRLQ